MEEINAVTPQQIDTLRKAFNEKVASQNPDFHPDDLERVKLDELWLRRWIAHAEFNMDNAVSLLYDCCQWRKEFGTNELNESKVSREMLDKGTLFIRNQDKWGKKLLIFKAKTHTKGTVDMDLLQKFVVYYFERIERESGSDQISIIFDMKDTGWNNMDMDFVRYLITLLKTYYPYFVNYLVIFEMPWLLNAAWKIIKGWLPPKFVDRVKFQDKKTLQEFIDVDNQLAEWGGKDNYVYKFEPTSQPKRHFNNNMTQPSGASTANIAVAVAAAAFLERSPGTPVPQFSQSNTLAEVEDRILFRPSASSNDQYSTILQVKNNSPNGDSLIVKIKTTSPDRYRVRPIIFILKPKATGSVNIDTHSGVSAATMPKDRFQVQVAIIPPDVSTPEPDANQSSENGHFGLLFKKIVGSGVQFEMYRVNVTVEARAGDTGSGSGMISLNDDRLRKGLDDLEKKITESVSKQVMVKVQRIERIVILAAIVIILLLLGIFALVYKMSSTCGFNGGILTTISASGGISGTCSSPEH